MSLNIFTFKFQSKRVIILQNILDKYEKEMLLLDSVDAKKKLVAALKRRLSVIYTIIKDLAFFLI